MQYRGAGLHSEFVHERFQSKPDPDISEFSFLDSRVRLPKRFSPPKRSTEKTRFARLGVESLGYEKRLWISPSPFHISPALLPETHVVFDCLSDLNEFSFSFSNQTRISCFNDSVKCQMEYIMIKMADFSLILL